MSHRTLRCYDYVNQPYARVRDALLANPHYVFRHATAAAAIEAAKLHVRVGAIDVGTDVIIRILGIAHDTAYDEPATKLTLEWSAARNPGLFPTMMATLAIFPLSATETQLELEGQYRPPMGKLGEAIDAAAGHRLADASVTRFIQEVAGWLREELALPVATDATPPSPTPAVLDTEC
jgi:hypothetical protein